MKTTRLLVYLVVIFIITPVPHLEAQEPTIIYTRVVDVSLSLSNYTVVDYYQSNITYQYTAHTFKITGEHLNVEDDPWLYYYDDCQGQIDNRLILTVENSSSDFVNPYQPPVTCLDILEQSSLPSGITLIQKQISLHTLDNSTSFADGVYNIKFNFGYDTDIMEHTETTVIVENGSIENLMSDYPLIWSEYQYNDGTDTDMSDQVNENIELPVPYSLVFVSLIAIPIIRSKLNS